MAATIVILAGELCVKSKISVGYLLILISNVTGRWRCAVPKRNNVQTNV